jgi:hypothetical protein
MKYSINAAILLMGMAALGAPAKADSIKFYTGGSGYVGPTFSNQAGSVYAQTKGNATNCPTVGSCTNDNIAASLTFNVTGNVITATATYNGGANKVWDDLSPNFGGLGVGLGDGTTPYHNGDDQVNGYELLHIHFLNSVSLTGIGTLFASGHAPFGTGSSFQTPNSILSSNSFLFSLNGSTFSSVTFGAANDGPFTSGFSNDFYFKEAGCTGSVGHETCTQPEFYLSALTYQRVPGPLAGAGLPGLFFVGAGLAAWWRRKKIRNGATTEKRTSLI